MTTTHLLVRRSRSSLSGLAAVALVPFVTALVLGVTLGLVSAGIASGSRTALENTAARGAAVRVTTHLSDDPGRQNAAAARAFGQLFPRGTTLVLRSERSLPLDLRRVGVTPQAAGTMAVFGVEPRLTTTTQIVDGALPANGIPQAGTVAVQSDTATRLGAHVGDAITVGSGTQIVRLTIAATWTATDPTAAEWFADSSIGSGQIDGADGLFVVSPATLQSLPTQFFVRWTLVATPQAVSSDHIDAVRAGVDRLPHTIEVAPDLVLTSSSVEGTLANTLSRIAQSSRAAQAIAAAPVCIVGMLGLVALLQLCTLLVASRRDQTRLARARGLSVRQLATITVVESIGVALPGVVVGSLLAAVLVTFVTGTAGATAAGQYIAVDLGIVVITLLAMLGVTLRDVLGSSEEREPRRSPIGFLLVGAAIAVAAGLSTWQLFSQGTPLSGGTGGRVNLIASASPALTLIAVAVIGAAFVIPVSTYLARTASRRQSLAGVLATRQVARRTAHYLVPVLAVSIAVASGAVASGMNATWVSTQRATQLATIATDVNVSLTPSATATDATAAVSSANFAAIDRVRAAMSLVNSTATVSGEKFPFVGVTPDSLARVIGPDATTAATALRSGPSFAGVAVPVGASRLTAEVSLSGDGHPARGVSFFLWIADADGALTRVPLTAAKSGTTSTAEMSLTGALPPGAPHFSVVAFAAERPGMPDARPATLALTALGSASNGEEAPLVVPGTAPTLSITGDAPSARTLLVPPASTALPVVATQALADRLGVSVGDRMTLSLGSSPIPQSATLIATVAAIPGAGSNLALTADLAAVDALSLVSGAQPVRTSAVWIATDHPAAVAAAVTRIAVNPAVVSTAASTSVETTLAPAIDAFWLAAAGAIILALIALAASIRGDSRARRTEVSVLRALGLTAAQQGSSRAHEQRITLTCALVIGVAAGLIAVAVTVTPFAAAAVPGAGDLLRINPNLGVAAWFGTALVLALSCIAVVLNSVAEVRRRARVAQVEETRA